MKARVLESYRNDGDNRPRAFGGGPIGTLRAYQAFHPDAAIYTVTYRGRTVWMTSKQQHIWHEVQKYWRRGKRDTLARIASVVGCSRATVSRFLRRLDLWRFIDLAAIPGRNGGTYILTRQNVEPFKRWTMSMRARVRVALARRVKRWALEELGLLQEWQRHPVKGGSTGATFTALTGSQLTLSEAEM